MSIAAELGANDQRGLSAEPGSSQLSRFEESNGDRRVTSLRRIALSLGPMVLFLAVFVWLIAPLVTTYSGPSGAGYGSDFATFYQASKLLEAGKNPYDDNLLWKTERRDFARGGLHVPPDRLVVRVGNPPIFFWALRPLTGLPFRLAGFIWTGGMYLLSLLGFLLLLRLLGWRRRVVPAAIFLAMPQVVLGAFYGDLIGFIFSAVVVSLAVAKRYPLLSGAVLSLCWLKPHIGLPAAVLILALHTEERRKPLLGFLGASLLLLALTGWAVGITGIHEWITGLLGWTGSLKGQPKIASLAGLYYLWAAPALRICLGLLTLAAAGGATWLAWRRFQPRLPAPRAVAWLWVLWLLCVPYAHINDEMLLAIPVLLLIGRDGRDLFRARSLTVLYLLCFCFVLNVIPGVPVDLEPLKLSAVMVVLAWPDRRGRARSRHVLDIGHRRSDLAAKLRPANRVKVEI